MNDLVHPWRYEGSKLVCQYCKIAKKEYELLTSNARQSIDGRCIAFQSQHLSKGKGTDNKNYTQTNLFVWKAKKEVK